MPQRRSEEKTESLLQRFQMNTMESIEKMMKQTNDTSRIATTRKNTTMEKIKKTVTTNTAE